MADIEYKGMIYVDKDPIWIFHEENSLWDITIQLIKFEHDYICDLVASDTQENIYRYRNDNIRPQPKVLNDLYIYYNRLTRLIQERHDAENND